MYTCTSVFTRGSWESFLSTDSNMLCIKSHAYIYIYGDYSLCVPWENRLKRNAHWSRISPWHTKYVVNFFLPKYRTFAYSEFFHGHGEFNDRKYGQETVEKGKGKIDPEKYVQWLAKHAQSWRKRTYGMERLYANICFVWLFNELSKKKAAFSGCVSVRSDSMVFLFSSHLFSHFRIFLVLSLLAENLVQFAIP